MFVCTGNIHPRNKQEVGRRLALVADHIAYGQNVNYLVRAKRSKERRM
jgi:hypothetical protein